MDFLLYIISGAFVGLIVGMTGVGGGSLMTPLLIMFGIPYNVAIGTDLLYASITKSSGVIAHTRQNSVQWRLVGYLAAGSIPASIVTVILLNQVFTNADEYKDLLTTSLGVMLIITAIVILFKRFLRDTSDRPHGPVGAFFQVHATKVTFVVGIFLGIFVTLSSVGAGAFCAALLMTLYPRLPALHVIGTDIAHAVPLTLIAGLSHLFLLGNVDLVLLVSLLIGSLPAIHVGTKLAVHIPSRVLQPALALILLGIGVKFTFY
ncbi:MAG: sulfite exporter TauE/SafE family protein [Porticoccus sp.]|nr:sulfite exporter TauE/SafE family protein [Porticoccus sp.]